MYVFDFVYLLNIRSIITVVYFRNFAKHFVYSRAAHCEFG